MPGPHRFRQTFGTAQRFERFRVPLAFDRLALRLQGLVAQQAQAQARGAAVAGADGAHFAFADPFGEGWKRLFQRRGAVVFVALVQVGRPGVQRTWSRPGMARELTNSSGRLEVLTTA